jgi:hypothetical protein
MPFFVVTVTEGKTELLSARLEAKNMTHAKALALAALKKQLGHAKGIAGLAVGELVVTAQKSEAPEGIPKAGGESR